MWNKEAPAAGAGGALCSIPGPSTLGWHTLTRLDGSTQCRNRDHTDKRLFLNFSSVKELSTERHFIVWTAKLNQHKVILILKFESKDMLL